MNTTKRNGREKTFSTFVDIDVELNPRSGLDESLRYTKRGYRRTDDEILGIMKKRRQKKADRQKKLKLERKIRNKAETLLRKKLRGSGFEELNEGDFYRSIEVQILDDVVATSPVSKGVSEKSMRREQHRLVQAANKRNKMMKKQRKLSRRIEAEAKTCRVCVSTTADGDFKDVFTDDPDEIEFVNAINRDMEDTLRMRGYRDCGYGIWRSKFTHLYTDVAVDGIVLPDVKTGDNEFDFIDEKEVVEFDRMYNTMLKSAIDVKAKAETLDAAPAMMETIKSQMKQDISSGIFKWLHARSADPVLLSNVDMVVSLIDMLWLVYTEPNANRRVGIVHLWIGTLGLNVETKWACSALAGLILRLTTETPKVVSESWSNTLEEAVSFAKRVHNTPFIMAVRDLFVSLASMKFFSKEVALNIYQHLGRPKESNLMELSFLAIESLARVLRVAELIYAGVPLSKALFSENPTEAALS